MIARENKEESEGGEEESESERAEIFFFFSSIGDIFINGDVYDDDSDDEF